jgi:hypothetical protein
LVKEPATRAVAESASMVETPVANTFAWRLRPALATVCSAATTPSSKDVLNLGVITAETSSRYFGIWPWSSSRSGP